MNARARNPALVGVGLIILATFTAAAGDGVTKSLGQSVPSGPVLFWLGILIVVFASALHIVPKRPLLVGSLRTAMPGLMGLRSGLSVVSTMCFFQAFAMLQLAEVFLFIGMMPVMAAILARIWLHETVTMGGWLALCMGVVGMTFLFPGGIATLGWGHAFAVFAALAGTGSLVVLRWMSLKEHNPFGHLVYPHIALALVALPMGYGEMPPLPAFIIGMIVLLAVLVLLTRALAIFAFTLIPAHVATMLMNLQFVWMLGIGFFAFAETPAIGVLAGAALVMSAGALLVAPHLRFAKAQALPVATPGE